MSITFSIFVFKAMYQAGIQIVPRWILFTTDKALITNDCAASLQVGGALTISCVTIPEEKNMFQVDMQLIPQSNPLSFKLISATQKNLESTPPFPSGNSMKALTIPLKHKLTYAFFSVFIISFNPALAQSDKQMMGEVQKARELARQKEGHSKHIKLVDESQKFRGVYYGYLPCKSCAGIKTTLSLKNKQNYLLVTQYAQASTREFYEKGKYTWDDRSRTVTLIARKDSSIRKYAIKNDSTLIQLTPEGVPMKGNQDQFSLIRSDKMNSREVHIH